MAGRSAKAKPPIKPTVSGPSLVALLAQSIRVEVARLRRLRAVGQLPVELGLTEGCSDADLASLLGQAVAALQNGAMAPANVGMPANDPMMARQVFIDQLVRRAIRSALAQMA